MGKELFWVKVQCEEVNLRVLFFITKKRNEKDKNVSSKPRKCLRKSLFYHVVEGSHCDEISLK